MLDADLVNAALSQAGPEASADMSPSIPSLPNLKVLEIQRAEPVRRPDVISPQLEAISQTLSRTLEYDAPRKSLQELVEKFDQEKRILFTRSESQAIDRMVMALATRLNAQIKVSHVIRALVGLLLNAEAEVDRRAGEGGPLVRPANGDSQAIQRFERELAKIVGSAIRDAGPLR